MKLHESDSYGCRSAASTLDSSTTFPLMTGDLSHNILWIAQ
ncbi:MAG: hypothetical protein ACLQU9_07320 [Acidimicrobiales bacterium]